MLTSTFRNRRHGATSGTFDSLAASIVRSPRASTETPDIEIVSHTFVKASVHSGLDADCGSGVQRRMAEWNLMNREGIATHGLGFLLGAPRFCTRPAIYCMLIPIPQPSVATCVRLRLHTQIQNIAFSFDFGVGIYFLDEPKRD